MIVKPMTFFVIVEVVAEDEHGLCERGIGDRELQEFEGLCPGRGS